MTEYVPTYRIGDKVVARGSYSHVLSAGETYTVVDNTAPAQVENFRFPEYTTVEDFQGRRSQWYPWRFRPA